MAKSGNVEHPRTDVELGKRAPQITQEMQAFPVLFLSKRNVDCRYSIWSTNRLQYCPKLKTSKYSKSNISSNFTLVSGGSSEMARRKTPGPTGVNPFETEPETSSSPPDESEVGGVRFTSLLHPSPSPASSGAPDSDKER